MSKNGEFVFGSLLSNLKKGTLKNIPMFLARDTDKVMHYAESIMPPKKIQWICPSPIWNTGMSFNWRSFGGHHLGGGGMSTKHL